MYCEYSGWSLRLIWGFIGCFGVKTTNIEELEQVHDPFWKHFRKQQLYVWYNDELSFDYPNACAPVHNIHLIELINSLHLSNILVRELMVKARGLCINFHSTYGYFYVWFSSKCIDILHFDPFTWVFLLNVVLLNKSDTSIVLWEYNNTLISDVLRRNTNLLVHIILHTCDQYLLRIPINCIGIV